ncbi:MAG: hypothetical protein ACKOQ4_08765, partial [Mycobacterium sp.]
MIRPERRTRGDLIAAAAIAAVVALLIGAFWWRSSARATISRPAAEPAPSVAGASAESVGAEVFSTCPVPAWPPRVRWRERLRA